MININLVTRYIHFFAWILLFFLTFNNSAYAYLDPGTGSMILQGIVAGIAAFFTGLIFYWRKLQIFLKKVFRQKYKGHVKKK